MRAIHHDWTVNGASSNRELDVKVRVQNLRLSMLVIPLERGGPRKSYKVHSLHKSFDVQQILERAVRQRISRAGHGKCWWIPKTLGARHSGWINTENLKFSTYSKTNSFPKPYDNRISTWLGVTRTARQNQCVHHKRIS